MSGCCPVCGHDMCMCDDIVVNKKEHENINFQTQDSLPIRKRIKVGIVITYSMSNADLGNFTDAEGLIPVGIKHMIEIEKNPRKKTVFDILDLD